MTQEWINNNVTCIMSEFERRLIFFAKENGIKKPIHLQPTNEEIEKIKKGVQEYFDRVLSKK